MPRTENHSLGRRGEDEALKLLRLSGYRILERNVRSHFGEIDVVAREKSALCFIEIKARKGLNFGFPEEAVGREKQWRLRRLADWYLQFHRLAETSVRFDVVSILFDDGGQVFRTRLIRAAF